MRLERKLFQLIVFFLPTQLTLYFWPNFANIFGLKIDYLAPVVYSTDLLIILLFVLQTPKIPKKLLLLAPLIIINTLFATNKALTTISWLKIAPDILFALYVYQNAHEVKQLIKKPLLISLSLVTTIALVQFMLGSSIGGTFYWLGERSLTVYTPGIATARLFGTEFLRPYGTFPHPNALAGFLGASALFLGNLLVLIALPFTFSRNAIGTLFTVLMFKKILAKKTTIFVLITLSLLLPILAANKQSLNLSLLDKPTIARRLVLANWAGEIASENPIAGSGLGSFVLEVSKQKDIKEFRAETLDSLLQPVHNIYLLLLTETGALGLLFFVAVYSSAFSKTKDKKILTALMFVATTGLFDHYWLTIKQTRLLLFMLLALALSKDKR